MKVILKFTRRGTVKLPAPLLEALASEPGDQLIAELTADGLLLRPAVTLPIQAYTKERIRAFDEAEAELAGALSPKKKSRRPSAVPKVGTRRR